jgi:hypothetical protein
MIAERDRSLRTARAFLCADAGAVRDRAAPEYPLAATSIAPGPRARFKIGSPDRLGFVLEYAYRTWLPGTGRPRSPAFDIVEAESGGALYLVLPLD